MADARFRGATETMVLCSVRDVAASLREARRVLRPGGKLLLIEHVAAPAGSPLRAMQVREQLQERLHACHLVLTRVLLLRRTGRA